MSSVTPTAAAASASSNGDSATHVTVPKSAMDFFSQAAPKLHAYVRELQSENAALRSQNAALRADAEILDGISDFLAEMSKSDLNYAQFMKLKSKQVEDEKRAAAAAASKAGGPQTKLPLPPLKDVPPAAPATAAAPGSAASSSSSAAPVPSASASRSLAASTAPPARSPRVRPSQKRPAPKPAGSGAHWAFTAASGSNPALRHCTPYEHEYASFAKTRWIGRSILAVLCSDFKAPAAAAAADEDEGAAAASDPASAAESYYRQAITSGRVLVNDAAVSPEYVLQSGDHIRQRVHRHEPPVPDFNASAEGAHRVRIISESADLLVVDKPCGIPVHESGKYFHQSLLGILANQLPPGSPALLPVHRLDKLTSGVVLLAKNPATAARLGAIIKGEGEKDDDDEASVSNGSAPAANAGVLRKVYLARVNGRFPSSPSDLPATVAGLSPALTAEGFLSLSAPLRVISQRAGLHAVDFSSESGAKPAVTLFRALSYDARSDTSVVEVHPQTGRTHQIRVHLQHVGFPITNDPIYGGALYEGNSYGATGEGHPDPAVRTKQPGAWDPACADCVNQLYYAAPKDDAAAIRYCTGIWLHALSYSFTPAAAFSASTHASTAAASAAASSTQTHAQEHAFVDRMINAAKLDEAAAASGQPAAAHKLAMLPEVQAQLSNPAVADRLLEAGLLRALCLWLAPESDGSLPHIQLRTSIYPLLRGVPITESLLASSSGFGRRIMRLWKDPAESESNKRLLTELLENWMKLMLGGNSDDTEDSGQAIVESATKSGFAFTTASVEWAQEGFDVVAALGKRVKATAKASDLLAAAAASTGPAAAASSSSSAAASSSASASPPPPSLCIRASLPSDVAAITRIYAHHVTHGTASFEEIAPSEAEMSSRRSEVLGRGLPFIVATVPSADPSAAPIVVGFAYANLFRLRTAYRFTVENSIYLDPAYCARRGVGAALLRPLLSQLQSAGYRQVLAVIGDSANAASIGLHSKFGFQHLGTMERVGLKFGRWLDVVFMQLDLKQGDQSVPNSDPKACVESAEGSGSS